MLGARWFRSVKVQSPLAKSLGAIWLVMFRSCAAGVCCPDKCAGMHVIPIEGLLGRVVGDVLIHYLNVVGAYIVCAHRAGGCAISLHRILVLGDSALGSHALRFRDCTVESLQGLAAGARQEAPAERTGTTTDFEAGGEDATDPVAAHFSRTRKCLPSRAAPASRRMMAEEEAPKADAEIRYRNWRNSGGTAGSERVDGIDSRS